MLQGILSKIPFEKRSVLFTLQQKRINPMQDAQTFELKQSQIFNSK